MLDLVKQEAERIESRFLEPACGTGNFLTEILERKLRVVEDRYATSQLEYERYAVLAVSSIYGIDILEDNVQQCRHRLFGIFDLNYLRLFKNKTNDHCREAVRFILDRNIIHGDRSRSRRWRKARYMSFRVSRRQRQHAQTRDFTFQDGWITQPLQARRFFRLGEDVFIRRR